MILGLLIIASLLAVTYAAFTTGVKCAGNRQLRLVFVRVLALLGLVALGGAWVGVLRAEPATADDEIATENVADASVEEAAEIVVEAFGQIDDDFIDRYADLEQFLAVDKADAEPTADEFVVEVVPALEVEDDDTVEPVVIACRSLEQLEFVDNGDGNTFPISVSTEPPPWVGNPGFMGGSDDHWTSVESGPWLTDAEAQTALNAVIVQAVADYVDDQVGRRGAARRIRISLNDIEAFEIVQERFADEYESSVGQMQRKHAKLVFTPEFRSAVAVRWQEQQVAQRLLKTGFGIAAIMALLFVSLGVFKRLGSSAR